MKPTLFIVAAVLAIGAAASSAQAQNYPWCSYYGPNGPRNCGFSSFEQCQQNVSGIGGFCQQNPQYTPPSGSHRRMGER
jgi:hypothetical protein